VPDLRETPSVTVLVDVQAADGRVLAAEVEVLDYRDFCEVSVRRLYDASGAEITSTPLYRVLGDEACDVLEEKAVEMARRAA
jgi:hypothetical protein